MTAALSSHRELAAQRRADVTNLTRAGRSAPDIAATLGITRRHVERIRQQVGIARTAPSVLTADEIRRAKDLLDDGCSYSETARTIGRSVKAIRHRFPGQGWQVGGFGEIAHLQSAVNRIKAAS